MIIAIDGPAGAGKSTVARAVAARLGFAFLDTGALYRCAVLAGIRLGEPPEQAVTGLKIELGDRVLLEGEDVTDEIRGPEINQLTPAAAARPELRAALTEKQRKLLRHGDWVAEGRDIGTVVVPTADLKIFLTASIEARAGRRALEQGLEPARVRDALIVRDRMDREREHGRLYAAPDAVELDTTEMTLDEAVERVLQLVPDRYRTRPALSPRPPRA
jgi:cytidylate kinase